MLEKLYKKSEVWFAVLFIVLYVVGNSVLMEYSDQIGMEMVLTIPYNLLLLVIIFSFVMKRELMRYYGIGKVQCSAGRLLFYIPLIVISTVNVWFGFRMKMAPMAAVVYFAAMILTGIIEEMLFRGLLFKAMSRKNIKAAIIVTSITFGIGHIVNLLNGETSLDTICQIFYAIAIGFLLAAVLYVGKSILPCMVTHALFNAFSTFANESAFARFQIPVSIALCVISAVSAVVIFKMTDKA